MFSPVFSRLELAQPHSQENMINSDTYPPALENFDVTRERLAKKLPVGEENHSCMTAYASYH